MSTTLKRILSIALATALLSTSVYAAPATQSTALTTASYTEIALNATTNAPDFYSGLVLARKNGKVGFLNQNGQEAIPFVYTDAYSFVNGVAPVYRDGRWSFIGVNGNTVVAPEYYTLVRTSAGGYIASSPSGNCLLDESGRQIASTTTGYIRQSGEVYIVTDAESERYYQDGQLVYEIDNVHTTSATMQEEMVEVFSDGYAVVYRGNTCGIRTLTGETLFQPSTFDGIIPLGEDGALFNEYGLAIFQNFHTASSDYGETTTYGIINNAGKALTKNYQYISEFSDGYAWAATSDTQYVILDSTGDVAAKVSRTMQTPTAFSNGVAVITDDSNVKHGLMTTEGKYMSSMLYSSIGSYNGMAAVATKQKTSSNSSLAIDYGLILSDGQFHEVEEASTIKETSYGMHFIFTKYGAYGILNSNGAVTVTADYQEIRPLSAFTSNRDLTESMNEIPLFFARKNGMWGMIDANGKVLIPFNNYYCAVYGESDGMLAVTTDDDTYYIDADTLTVANTVVGDASGVVSGLYVVENRGYCSLNRMAYADTAAGFATAVYGDVLDGENFLPTAMLNTATLDGDATEIITTAITNLPTTYWQSIPHQQALYDFIGESMTVAASKSTSSATASISNTNLSRAGQVYDRGASTVDDLLSDRDLSFVRAFENVYRYTSTSTADEVSFRIYATSYYDTDAFELMTSFGGVRVAADDIRALEDMDVTITLKNDDGAMTVTLPEGVSGTVLLPATATYASIVNEAGIRIGGLPQPFTTMRTAPIAGSGTYHVEVNAVPFADITYLPQEMKVAVSTLNAMGVIEGTTATTFSADQTLSRAEMCAMLLRLLAVSDHATENNFTDLHTNDWFYQTALDANALGLITGFGDHTYRGGAIMSRTEGYIVLSRVLSEYMGYEVDDDYDVLSGFGDANTLGSWVDVTAICANENLVIPQSNNTLSIGTQLTRGDAAVLLYRLAKLL